jgi:hypothetical protein
MFKPGKSGNPGGRPKGIPNPSTRLRHAIEKDIPEIIKAMVDAAKGGDVSAASLLLSRVLPPLRPEAQTATLPDTGTSLADRANAIASAALAGELPTSTASDLMSVLQGQARIKEIDDIEQRLKIIEERLT